jgi:hypothetical protein
MIKPYRIECMNNSELLKTMEFLFTKGFVFTYTRIKSLSETVENYAPGHLQWRYIYVFHNKNCFSIFNTAQDIIETTSEFPKGRYNGMFIPITPKNFIEKILPVFLSGVDLL